MAQHLWEAVEIKYLVLSALLLGVLGVELWGWGLFLWLGGDTKQAHKAGREEQIHVREVIRDGEGGQDRPGSLE